ncbi:MAG: PKD domain-containing protein [Bacteroidales bacterium]|nr:PKD domain-containing protein [Bacteroidales bacterium]
MKRFLLSAIAIFAMSMCSLAQSIVCTDNACTPITDQPFSTTSVPYYCADELTFEQGQAVDVCITIMCPETTNVTAHGIPATAQIQSLTITGFSNLPEGLSYCVSRVDLDPTTNVYATIHITGTAPSTNEDYDLELSGIFTGTASAFSQTIPLENENVTFATGIVLTIGEGQSLPSEIVCDDPCPAVTNQPMSQTTIPYYAPEELTYNVNEAVDVCITIQCPANTNVEYMGMQAAATITSMTITGFTNIPDGLSYCVSRTDMDPTTNNFATVLLTGTATTAGAFDLNISCEVTGTANITGMGTMPLNDFAITFPTGIVVTIEEQTSNPVVANFTSDPEATQLLGGSVIYITAGEIITYTNASENATSIAWTFEGGNPSSSTENTVEVTYATAGNYTTTLTAYGENNTESTKTVGVNVSSVPTPVFNVDFSADVTTIETGETVHFTNNTTATINNEPYAGTIYYRWIFGVNGATSTDENPSYTYETAGVYSVILAASDEEINTLDILGGWYPVQIKEDYIIVTDPVSVDETAISEINVYPNPTNSVINIAAENMQNITIMDMTGRVVMSKDVNSNFETISAEGFAKANYMVRIATADGVVVKNIVVE